VGKASKGGQLYLPGLSSASCAAEDSSSSGSSSGSSDAHALAGSVADSAQRVGVALAALGQKVAVAESAAGGLVSAALLAVPGASRFFAQGTVVYDKPSKTELLGLTAEEQAAARSATEAHALMLATAARRKAGSDWGVGETGVAGPGPNGRGVAPGACCVAVVGPGGQQHTVSMQHDAEGGAGGAGGRARMMQAFAGQAVAALAAAAEEAREQRAAEFAAAAKELEQSRL
jgi:PncC family amidohydrolase